MGQVAPIGLPLFFIGAVIARVRARVCCDIYFLALAVGSVLATWPVTSV